jgi:hypothetical protein
MHVLLLLANVHYAAGAVTHDYAAIDVYVYGQEIVSNSDG